MRLSSTILDDKITGALESHFGIRTDSDLLFRQSVFDLYKGLPPGTTTLAELEQYVNKAMQICAAPVHRGDILLAQELQISQSIPTLETGMVAFDEVLGESTEPIRILEILGPKDSGKTVHLKLHSVSS